MATALGTKESDAGYRFLRVLAEGGMGRVELVVKERGAFRRVYARKRLRPVHREDAAVRSMFLDEARIAGMIQHPNVVSVIDVGEDEGGPFLVMDFVRGMSLGKLCGEFAALGELPPVRFCAEVIAQTADGLHAAHELRGTGGDLLNVVHRDVSPQNVLLSFDGVARITDFGIARALGRTTKTSTGLLKGKAGYFSPEQLRFRKPDRRSDIFALGVVFYELLTARRAYKHTDQAEVARRILEEPAPDVDDVRRDVPAPLVDLLFRMLSKEPEDRPADAAEVARVLRAAVRDIDEGEDLSPGPFMAATFGEKREALDREIEQLIEAPTAADVAVQETPILEARPQKRGRALWVAASVTSVLIIGTTAYVLSNREAPSTDSTPSTSAPVEPTRAPVSDDGLNAEASAAPSDDAPRERPGHTTEPTEEGDGVASAPAPTMADGQARRRRRSGRRAPARGMTQTEEAAGNPATDELIDWNQRR